MEVPKLVTKVDESVSKFRVVVLRKDLRQAKTYQWHEASQSFWLTVLPHHLLSGFPVCTAQFTAKVLLALGWVGLAYVTKLFASAPKVNETSDARRRAKTLRMVGTFIVTLSSGSLLSLSECDLGRYNKNRLLRGHNNCF